MRSLKRWLSTHLYYRVLLVCASAIVIFNLAFFVFANIQNARETDRREETLSVLIGHLLTEEDESLVAAYLEHYVHVNGVDIVLKDAQGDLLFASMTAPSDAIFHDVFYEHVMVGSIYFDAQRSSLGLEYAYGFLALNALSLALLTIGILWLKRYLNSTVDRLERDLERADGESDDFSFQEVASLHRQIAEGKQREAAQKASHAASIRALAHDVKTPLSAAMLILEAIQTGRIESNAETLGELGDELRSIQSIVPRFVDVDPSVEPRRIDLVGFFNAFLMRHKEVFATKQMTVTLSLEPLDALLSETDLTRIAEHLVFNAFYYGKEGGTIIIRTNTAQRVLEIEDDGIGMSQATLEMLQDGPYRAEEARKRHATGGGQGIRIVREIVTRLSAEMEIHSTPNVGTTVWIRFPPLI